MKFKITKTSWHYEKEYEEEKDFLTIEELMEWCCSTGHAVIIDSKNNELEIYDDWRE